MRPRMQWHFPVQCRVSGREQKVPCDAPLPQPTTRVAITSITSPVCSALHFTALHCTSHLVQPPHDHSRDSLLSWPLSHVASDADAYAYAYAYAYAHTRTNPLPLQLDVTHNLALRPPQGFWLRPRPPCPLLTHGQRIIALCTHGPTVVG